MASAWGADDPIYGLKRGTDAAQRNLHDYIVSHSFRSNEALEGLQRESLNHRRSAMLSPPDSIPILQLLEKLTSAKTAIEVGVFTGYTTLGIALGLQKGGKVYALDISDEYPRIGKPFWEKAGVADRIELRIGHASKSLDVLLEAWRTLTCTRRRSATLISIAEHSNPKSLGLTLQELGPNSTDLAFIDADKPNYDSYYEKLLRLVRPGGVIVVDNVLWGGSVLNDKDQSVETQAIRTLNEKIVNDPRVHPAMLKNSDGITVAYKL